MPELPEVETVRRGLERLLVGRRIEAVEVLWAKSFPEADGLGPRDVIGRQVLAARRRAKALIIDLSGGLSLVAHLKMTGQMVVRGPEDWGAGHPTDSLLGALPDASTRVEVALSGGTRLFFNDQRKFGWIKAVASERVEAIPFIAALGPEPWDDGAPAEFSRRIAGRRTSPIKAALLDQAAVAGIGNIYADEALWAARVHPATPAGAVSERRRRALIAAAAEVMERSIALGGSSSRNYVDAEGRRGAYLDFANVFRREGQPCRRCGAVIVKTRVAGRGTHYCPRCQPLPTPIPAP
jgi:formamidopyrimidine-DNA glycosylase